MLLKKMNKYNSIMDKAKSKGVKVKFSDKRLMLEGKLDAIKQIKVLIDELHQTIKQLKFIKEIDNDFQSLLLSYLTKQFNGDSVFIQIYQSESQINSTSNLKSSTLDGNNNNDNDDKSSTYSGSHSETSVTDTIIGKHFCVTKN